MLQLDRLAERLLREGIAYRHVRRYVGELHDHYEDMVHAEVNRGAGDAEAHALALARLGDMDHLAQVMITRPELQALAGRYPRLWNGCAPTVIWFGMGIATVLAVIGFAGLLSQMGLLPEGGSPALALLQKPADAFLFFIVRILPIFVGGLMIVGAVRQRSGLFWPLLGAAFLAAVAAVSVATVSIPLAPDVQGEFRLAFGFASKELPQVILRTAGIFALMLTPILFWKRLTRLRS